MDFFDSFDLNEFSDFVDVHVIPHDYRHLLLLHFAKQVPDRLNYVASLLLTVLCISHFFSFCFIN